MRFGVREICDVVFKPLAAVDIGNQHFDAMQPVLYLDTAKTSSLEGASTTVYAQGGKGNPRLIGWDGEKTLTFTVEDALMSPLSFHMLSGAGVVKGAEATVEAGPQYIYVHQTYDLVIENTASPGADPVYVAKLPYDVRNGAEIIATVEAPIYATTLNAAGGQELSLSAIGAGEIQTQVGSATATAATINSDGTIDGLTDETNIIFTLAAEDYPDESIEANQTVRIDCYARYTEGAQELQIDAATFGGYYYIEASTLFRDETTGQDFPAEFVIPRGKIQSNFTFTMANSGDPSTFTFTIDAFPAYTKFDKTKKVMAALQILDPQAALHPYNVKSVLGHNDDRGTKDSDAYYDELYPNSSVANADKDPLTEQQDPGDTTQTPGQTTTP